jgi:hypothetical protein
LLIIYDLNLFTAELGDFNPDEHRDNYLADFQHYMLRSYFMLSDLRGEMVVRFVDIGGIVDHHCMI